MKIIMMGTGGYALPTFRALYETDHEILALFTRPEAVPQSRRPPPANAMRDLAARHGTPVFDPADVNSPTAQQVIRTLAPELLIVCDYGQILTAATLDLSRHGGLNLHASLLPKYRGAAPINWALYHGETETGNTVIHMTPQVDGGPCVAQETVTIDPDETAVDLETRLAARGARLVVAAVDRLQAGGLVEIPQDQQQVTRAPKLTKSDGAVDWTRSAQEIRNQVRAMQPWPKTYTSWLRAEHEPLRLILNQVGALHEATGDPAGTVVAAAGDQLHVATGDGLLAIHQLQPSGKRSMSAQEFLRGYLMRPGDRLGAAAPR